ncbi:MAG: outer membrane protein assembly factor BamA [Verrucomicrobiae bacterium]|nr:outer membrane protein assembly factor BamA [Verrucomicrobiae bacterium]
MKTTRPRRFGTGLLMWLLAFAPLGAQEQTYFVKEVEIRHVGPVPISDSVILANVQTKAGQSTTRTALGQDVRNLYATGYFTNVHVAQEDVEGGIKVIFTVQGKAKIKEIILQGNKKVKASRLRKEMDIKVGEPLDERKVVLAQKKMEEYYEKAGYERAKIAYDVTIDQQTGQGVITFRITEGPRVDIIDITFTGNDHYPKATLQKQMKTKRKWWLSWIVRTNVMKKEQWQDDLDKLRDFYHNEGYVDMQITDVKFDYVKPERMYIRISLVEGRKYLVGKLDIKGNNLFPSADIRGVLKMTEGKTFGPKALDKDIEAIRDYYGAKGYIDARVTPIRQANVETGRMDVVYEIVEGDISYVAKINIRGNVKTKDKVIRRELAVKPGEVFDMVKVKRSKQRLENLGFFSRVAAVPEPTEVPGHKDLSIEVTEQRTGQFVFGAGFSTVDALVGYAEVSQGNFDLFNPPLFSGGGQKARLRVQLGTKRQDFILSFTEPWFMDRKLALGFDAFRTRSSYLSDMYVETRTGADIHLTKELAPFTSGKVQYGYQVVDISDVPEDAAQIFRDEEGNRSVSAVTATLTRDTRDSFFVTTRGNKTEVVGEVAGGPFSGGTDVYKMELKTQQYFPLPFTWPTRDRKHVILLAGAAGVVDSYGSEGNVPLFNRFFLGGPNNLRGFRYRDVGPKVSDLPLQKQLNAYGVPSDDQDETVGGNTYAWATFEYIIPLIERIRFAIFYDIGFVNRDSYDFSMSNYNDDFGFGLRLDLPIGPIRFDYGIPITTDKHNNRGGRFNFNIGYQF